MIGGVPIYINMVYRTVVWYVTRSYIVFGGGLEPSEGLKDLHWLAFLQGKWESEKSSLDALLANLYYSKI